MRLAPLATLALVTVAVPAAADQSVIKRPGAHPSYVFEAEPHVLVDLFDDFVPGVGFRGTFEIVDNGFISKINNTVGVGVGADLTDNTLMVPVVMQWNFWLSRNWSVFGEPGVALKFRDRGKDDTKVDPFIVYAGGRFHFSDRVTLTMRAGRPLASVGVSFLL